MIGYLLNIFLVYTKITKKSSINNPKIKPQVSLVIPNDVINNNY